MLLWITWKNTHTHPFNGPFSWTTQVSQYQKGKTNLDFTEARDSEWQWHQLGHMQVCTLLRTDNHASTSPVSFLPAVCPSCHPTNSFKALKARLNYIKEPIIHFLYRPSLIFDTFYKYNTCDTYFSLLDELLLTLYCYVFCVYCIL